MYPLRHWGRAKYALLSDILLTCLYQFNCIVWGDLAPRVVKFPSFQVQLLRSELPLSVTPLIRRKTQHSLTKKNKINLSFNNG